MRNNEINTYDMPDHEIGSSTSSIGNIGRPERDSFGRHKGFHLNLVDSHASLEALRQEFHQAQMRIEADGQFTRLQHRAIIMEDLLMAGGNDLIDNHLEAVVPLDMQADGKRPCVVYLGDNSRLRTQDPLDVIAIMENIVKAQDTPQRSVEQIFSKAEINGYQVQIGSEINGPETEDFLDQLYGLYKRFNWEKKDVREIINNPNAILGIAREGGQIVSAGIAELGQIEIRGMETFRMAEITEAATLSDHGRRGLYTAISTRLIQELADRSAKSDIFGGKLNVVFGECNGISLGVLMVSTMQGRQFSSVDTDRMGYGARLVRQQVPIAGIDVNTPYNDLVVTSLTGEQLISNYERRE